MSDPEPIINYDDQFINELILCPKKIIANPKPKDKSNGLHKETNIELQSEDKKFRFTVFIREHTELLENFTVGLIFHPENSDSRIIVRYNGNHGRHTNQVDKEIIDGFHIHKLTKNALDLGIKEDNQATQTTNYASVRDAMFCFFKDLNILNFQDYFPKLLQTTLLN